MEEDNLCPPCYRRVNIFTPISWSMPHLRKRSSFTASIQLLWEEEQERALSKNGGNCFFFKSEFQEFCSINCIPLLLGYPSKAWSCVFSCKAAGRKQPWCMLEGEHLSVASLKAEDLCEPSLSSPICHIR